MIKYLLDTGPLYDYLVIVSKELNHESKEWSQLSHINSPVKYALFERFLAANKPLMTVSGALIEAKGLFLRGTRARCESDTLLGPRGFWRRVWHVVGHGGSIMDSGFGLSRLGIDIIESVGPVDGSLVEVAREFMARQEAACIITGDRELFGKYQQVAPMLWIDSILTGMA